MMSAVISSIQNSEAIIAVVDSSRDPKEALAMFQPGNNWTGPPMAVLLNKGDLLSEDELAELSDWCVFALRLFSIGAGDEQAAWDSRVLTDEEAERRPHGSVGFA
eukprot:366555-Chlamydomonas_euryale.AAC.18